MSETSSFAPAQIEGLALEVCEWLPSSAEASVLRVRARWTGDPAEPELPRLWIRSQGASHCFDPLPDARLDRGPGVWRGTYVVPAGLVTEGPGELWLAWPGGTRWALPEPVDVTESPDAPATPATAPPWPGSSAPPSGAGSDDPRAPSGAGPDDPWARSGGGSDDPRAPSGGGSDDPPAPQGAGSADGPPEPPGAGSDRPPAPRGAGAHDAPPAAGPGSRDTGAQLSDGAGLADPRAGRAHASERVQAGVAEEALRAVESLEPRVQKLPRERAEPGAPSVSASGGGLAAEAPERPLAHGRDAPPAGARLREWRLHLRTSELVRSGEAPGLAAGQGQRSVNGGLRDALAAERRERQAEAAAFAAELERVGVALESARREAAEATATLGRARREHDARLAEATATERRLRELLAARDSVQVAARAELDERDHELSWLRAQLAEARVRLETAAAQAGAREAELERRLRALDHALADERRALVAARAELASQRAQLAAAEALGGVEAAARAALDDQLDRERAARAALAAALEAAHETVPDVRAVLETARSEAATARQTLATLGAQLAVARQDAEAERTRAATLERDLRSAREAADTTRDRLATLEAALAAAHRAQEAARTQLTGLEADLAAERARRAAVEAQLAAERAGESLVAELDRLAARVPGQGELQRQASEQAAAASRVQQPEAAQVRRLAADLDAAAAALRARMPVPADVAPADAAGEPLAPAVEATPDDGASAASSTPAVEAPPEEDASTASPAPAVEPGPSVPSEARAPGQARHRLRDALVRLAREDPATAARILVGLLPAQGSLLGRDVDYDVTIGDAGTYAVTVAADRAEVHPLDTARAREHAEFHLTGDARSLAALLAGDGPRVRRFRGPVRASGGRRRVRALVETLPSSRQSLADAVQAGARFDADLLFPVLPYAIEPSWVRGHTFTVEHRTGDSTWYLVARDVAGLTVTRSAPASPPDATVTMTPATFQQLLRGEPVAHGERPSIRGDRVAVDLLRRWMARARGLGQSD